MSKKETKILILCPYPFGSAPGQRFRYEQYLKILDEAGVAVAIAPFLSASSMTILYKPGYLFQKTWNVLLGFIKRFFLLFSTFRYQYIFIFREASPVGPPIFEFLLFFLRRRVVYDFDDAIFVPRLSKANPFLGVVKWTSKVAYICRHSYKVSACNPFLVKWALQYNQNVILIPTTIDPEYHKPLPKDRAQSDILVIGWTGSQSNLIYLDLVRAAIVKLQEKYRFEFCVICDVDPCFRDVANYRFIPWRLETEILDLNRFDIGLMPVPEGAWEKGKVGFKAIQYSALEIVPVVSSVGSGHEVVEHERTGFVVDNTESDWYGALERLLVDPDLRQRLGRAARQRIFDKYSVPSQAKNYISLFQ